MKEKEILKINGFKWDTELQGWLRDDGFLIIKKDGEYVISDGGYNFEQYKKNNEELIGYLAIKGIINRLF